MPKTVKEIVRWKLNNLKDKVHHAQQYVKKLQENVESMPMDFNSLNTVLDNMMLSFDEFASNFEVTDVSLGLDQSVQTPVKLLDGATSHFPPTQVSAKDIDNADILSRVDKLEVVVNDMRTAIHGGHDGETSHPTGILSHVSVLENSFNEGNQTLVSLEQRMKDMNVRHVSFVNEVRTKAMKEDRKKEMEDIAVTEQFKNLEENVQETMSDNNACKQRLICVEDELKSVNINEDQKKEQIQKLEGTVQEIISDSDVCNQRLTSVEDQLKSVKSIDDAKKSEEINNLKLQVTNLDKLTKTQIIERLSFLENRPLVAFSVYLKHSGPWGEGTVIQDVSGLITCLAKYLDPEKNLPHKAGPRL